MDISKLGESWFDIEGAKPEEILNFLAPLGLHPVMVKRCSDSASTPGVVSYDNAILLEFPVALNLDSLDPTFLTIVLRGPVLITIRSCPMPAIKELLRNIAAEKIPRISHLTQIVYLILDELTDLSVQAETEARDKTLSILNHL
jgi:Mg2+ and Co2+ transporter CorA